MHVLSERSAASTAWSEQRARGGPQGHWGPADAARRLEEMERVERWRRLWPVPRSLFIELRSWSFLLTDQEKETGKSK